MFNASKLNYCRVFVAIIAGCAAGITGMTGLVGFVTFFATTFLLSAGLYLKMSCKPAPYFKKGGDMWTDGVSQALMVRRPPPPPPAALARARMHAHARHPPMPTRAPTPPPPLRRSLTSCSGRSSTTLSTSTEHAMYTWRRAGRPRGAPATAPAIDRCA